MLRNFYVDGVPRRLWPTVHSEMLRSRNHAIVFRIVSLQTGDKRHAHASGEKRILAVCFLTAPPARIAKDIDIRRPEIETLHDVACASAHGLIMFRSGFGADHDCHVMNKRRVKSGG